MAGENEPVGVEAMVRVSESCLCCIKQIECDIREAYHKFKDKVHEAIGNCYEKTIETNFEVDTDFKCCEFEEE